MRRHLPLFAAMACSPDAKVTAFNALPKAVITSIEDGSSIDEGANLTLGGQVSDPDHDADELSASWFLNDEEACAATAPAADGTTNCEITAPAGTFTVRLEVMDSMDGAASDSVTVESVPIPPTDPPTIEITAPNPSGTYYIDTTIVLEANVSDTEDEPSALSVRWISDLAGEIEDPTGSIDSSGFTSLTAQLGAGTHLLTATVTDTDGKTDTDQVTFEVLPGSSPELSIIAPADGSVFQAGEVVRFEATVSDIQDSPDAIAIAWESSIDGRIDSDPATSEGAIAFSTDTLSLGEHVITLTATDASEMTAADTLSIIVNDTPTVGDISITPDPALAGDSLTCSWAVTDTVGAEDRTQVVWQIDGVDAGTDATLSGGFVDDQTVNCTVTPADEHSEGEPVSAAIIIDNTPPIIDEVLLSPDPASVSTTFSCGVSGASDADGDDVTTSFSWAVNSDTIEATTDTLAAPAFARGDAVRCTVTPSDDEDAGTPIDSATVTIGNSSPVIDALTLDELAPKTDDTLTVEASASDADGGTPELSIEWFVDDTALATTDFTLSGVDWFDKGQTVYAIVHATDDEGATSSSTTDIATVGNTAPGTPVIAIVPAEEPLAGIDDLLCRVETDAPDADSDMLTYTFGWMVDGTEFDDATTTDWSGDTVGAEHTITGQNWTCIVTPSDDTEAGAATEASVEIAWPGWGADTVSLMVADWGFTGENEHDYAGMTVAGGGDLDCDGKADLLIGAKGHDSAGDSQVGKAYVILGGELDAGGSLPLEDASFGLIGSGDGASAASALDWIDDIDGDGCSDLIVGAPAYNYGVSDTGRIYLLTSDLLLDGAVTTLSAATHQYWGEDRDARTGEAMKGIQDMTGDAVSDILVAATGHASEQGKIYLLSGADLGEGGLAIDEIAAQEWIGESAGDKAGATVNGAGDLDGDGLEDILFGAPNEDQADTDAGAIYIVLAETAASTSTSSLLAADTKLLGEDYGDYAGLSIAGGRDVSGDGTPDVLVGTSYYNAGLTRQGVVYVLFGENLTDGISSLGAADIRIVGDERNDKVGHSVSMSMDVDADGLADVLIGAAGLSDQGGAGLFIGSNLRTMTGTISFSAADVLFTGEAIGDQAGVSVSGAGDVNGDGRDDLLIGANYSDEAETRAGKTYLLFSP